MKKTKIDWCDCTINPVVGCKNGCAYCYARKLNKRFGFIKNWEEPQFFPERLSQLYSKKGKSIFMDSMSDIGFWKKEWIDQVKNAIEDNPQHNYIFLTKGVEDSDCFALSGCFAIGKILSLRNARRNVFVGKTVDNNTAFCVFEQYDFLSIEPILEPIDLSMLPCNHQVRQIIIGAETGNRKGKVIPKKEWIDSIVRQCDEAGIRVFMKESLREIMGVDFRQDKLLWDK